MEKEIIGGIETVACPERPCWATRLLEGEVSPVKKTTGSCYVCGKEEELIEWEGTALCGDCAVADGNSPTEYIAARELFDRGITRDQAISAILHADEYCGDDRRGGNWSTGFSGELLKSGAWK